MKKAFLYVIILLLLVSLATAVEVSTDEDEYSSGESATVFISACTGNSIVKFLNPDGQVVDIKSGQGDWSTVYNTLSDSADGKFSVSAACENGKASSYFCVDAPGCLGLAPQGVPPPPPTPEQPGSGGVGCVPDWDCSAWSFCAADKTQSRSCTDKANCLPVKKETRSCEACQESWVCSLWAACQGATQDRACYDEHFCETTGDKPALQKGCDEADPFPPPARISPQLPPPFTGIIQAPKEGIFTRLWDNYRNVILAAGIVLLVAGLMVLAWYYLKPKKVAYNIAELKQWVRKEKEMGTSDEDIRQILKQNTGWDDEEITSAFESVGKPQASIKSVRKGSAVQ